MPTYVIRAHRGALAPPQRQDLAGELTRLHHEVTGAPVSFVQVVFEELDATEHFVGGRTTDRAAVFVHGHIRAGRSSDVVASLAAGVRDRVVAVAAVDAALVWVYLSELPAERMLEFGEVLPAPGGEEAWRAGLPSPVRERLDALDRNGP